MVRTKVKGTRYKAASNPEQEPDFYSMPPVSPDYQPRRPGKVTPLSASPVLSGSSDSASHIMSLAKVDIVDMTPLESSGTFDLSSLPPDSFEPLPLEPEHIASDADMQAVFDDPIQLDELSQAADFCATWDPAIDMEIQTALESDDKLEEMIQQLLEN